MNETNIKVTQNFCLGDTIKIDHRENIRIQRSQGVCLGIGVGKGGGGGAPLSEGNSCKHNVEPLSRGNPLHLSKVNHEGMETSVREHLPDCDKCRGLAIGNHLQ